MSMVIQRGEREHKIIAVEVDTAELVLPDGADVVEAYQSLPDEQVKEYDAVILTFATDAAYQAGIKIVDSFIGLLTEASHEKDADDGG